MQSIEKCNCLRSHYVSAISNANPDSNDNKTLLAQCEKERERLRPGMVYQLTLRLAFWRSAEAFRTPGPGPPFPDPTTLALGSARRKRRRPFAFGSAGPGAGRRHGGGHRSRRRALAGRLAAELAAGPVGKTGAGKTGHEAKQTRTSRKQNMTQNISKASTKQTPKQ